jgi:DNA-binding response OmpR family regulator
VRPSGGYDGAMSTVVERPLTVLVYSDDVTVRNAVRTALGRRPAADLPRVEYEDFATEAALVRRISQGGVDLAILDGEAVPSGGMGISMRLRREIHNAPPVLLLTGRPQDAWLATWSQAEAVVPHPIDPLVLARTAAALLRPRVAVTSS